MGVASMRSGRGEQVNDYTVIVNLAPEAITLGADSEDEAIARGRAIIAEQYGDSVANDATYQLEGEGNK